MLSQSETESIFRDFIPEDVQIEFVPLDKFIESALDNTFIQMQVAAGIYTEENIYTDFLSPACAYSQFRRLELCFPLMVGLADGVDDTLTTAFLTNMAMHEAHHFETNHIPTSGHEHALSELECIAATADKDPVLQAKASQFENESPIFQKVFARIADLQKEMVTG